VLDYAFYQARFLGDIKSEGEYIQYLKANYAEDPGYVDKVIKLSKK
jgi:flagellum-specific peptidoglycan hydrolase FlgJ